MRVNVQGTYDMGSVIDVEVVLSTNHRGHFVFKACPMAAEERMDADDDGDDDDDDGGGLSGLAPCEEILPKDGNGAYGESEIRTMKFRMILNRH